MRSQTSLRTTSRFPDLAQQLPEQVPDAPPRSPLTVVLDGRANGARVADIVPEGSLVVVDGLHEALRARGDDVLLVSDDEPLTDVALDALRAGLAADSACSTVSLDESSRPWMAGLPPPGTTTPRGDVVLVRRGDLLLALDEAQLAGPEASEDDGFVARLLTALGRPGFVHRTVGPVGPTPAPPAPARHPAAPRSEDRVVLDGRCLALPLSGTQVQLLGLLDGLVRIGANVAVWRPDDVHPTVAGDVARLSGDVAFVEASGLGRPAIFHRPFQIASLHDLAGCLAVGERLVLTHQDMIRDRIPAYSNSVDAWHDYRRATEAALTSADQVGFFSRHAAADAASDGALELDRATVVHLGVDHLPERFPADAAADPMSGRPYLLILGNAYWHKNRLFGLRLLEWLVERHGWDGGLVLAGEDPRIGSSVAAERAFIERFPSLRNRVVDLGRVAESERVALYRGAELVLFPSLYEGFGLIPFEAAALGTACTYAYRSSMLELLPAGGALPSFDLDEAGRFTLSLLSDVAARERVVADIRAAAAELTWERTAAGYLELYGRALARAPRSVSRLLVGVDPSGRRGLTEREAVLLDVYRRRRGFRLVVDGMLRTGSVALRGLRNARRGESP